MKRILFFSIALTIALSSEGQVSEWTLYNLNPVFQSIYVNPASRPLNKVSVGLPGISSIKADLRNTGFKIGDLIGDKIDPGKATNQMSKNNFLSLGASTDLFHLRVQFKKTYLGVYIQDNFTFSHSYPKEFYQVLWFGNEQFRGKSLDLKNLALDAMYYRTWGFHVNHQFKKLTLGANIKLLTGMGNVYTKNNKLDISFTDRYEVEANADAAIYTAGLVPNEVTEKRSDEEIEDQVIRYQSLQNPNKGWGLDLGAAYRFNKKWELGFAITNIGKIDWKEDSYQYKLNGSNTFQGLDILDEYLKDENINEKEIEDKLRNDFKESEGPAPNYTTWLSPTYTIQGKYYFSRKTFIANSIFIQKYKAVRIANSLALYHQFGRVLGGTISLNYAYKTINNIGLGAYLKLGSAQIYLVGDNVVGFALQTIAQGFEINKNSIAPLKLYNIRVGLNLVFGKVIQPAQQTY